jgi:hypothetical protein
MKKLNLLSLLLCLTVLIISCSSDSEAPKEQFKADGESFDFKNAKFYLTRSNNYSNDNGNFVWRDYLLTDGTYVSGNGWDLTHYTNATYFFAFEVLIPVGEDFLAGTYESVYDFNAMTSSSIYFYGETTDPNEFYEDNAESGEFVVSGGMEDGETMTVKFKGDLSHWTYIESWLEKEFTGSIFVKAKVEDVRPIPM